MSFRIDPHDPLMSRYDVCGIGNAIVDVVCEGDESFLARQSIQKGVMQLIDEGRATALYETMNGSSVQMSGGSVANAVAAVAALGGKGCYMGKVKDDPLGQFFAKDMADLGVHFPVKPAQDGPATARCLIFVTPDAERSMNTYLGACVGFEKEDIDPGQIINSKITFFEGYLFDPPKAKEAFRHGAKIAHETGRIVALSLSDLFCVERHQEDFRAFVRESVDILVGNEQELKALYNTDDFDSALAAARQDCELVAGTRGALGVAVADKDGAWEVPASLVEKLVDTTGAGDLFAGGFLYGLTCGKSPADSARVGTLSASAILGHFGPRPQCDLRDVVLGRGTKV